MSDVYEVRRKFGIETIQGGIRGTGVRDDTIWVDLDVSRVSLPGSQWPWGHNILRKYPAQLGATLLHAAKLRHSVAEGQRPPDRRGERLIAFCNVLL